MRWYILIHAINSPNVWLFNIHSPLFTTKITFDLFNWLFTSKGGNCILDFIIFATYCSDVQGLISNDIWWSTLLFVNFYYISQWSIFHSVCSHRSCCSNSYCAQVPQQSWACKIIVHDNVILEVCTTGSLLTKSAYTDGPIPSPMFW